MPLTGHVDRNYKIKLNTFDCMVSCPSRGTWIEMVSISSLSHKLAVVPLTGHVDRNNHGWYRVLVNYSRAPHGARG